MPVKGQLLINGNWQSGSAGQFSAVNPADGQTLAPAISQAGDEQISQVIESAQQAFLAYRKTSLADRAAFLRACAENIMALGDELLDTMQSETGYPRPRCEGERARTCGQLNMFADYIESGEHLNARIDSALPDRQPLPRPDIRRVNQALGVVVVFTVSNFPLAFSTAGGDTASALAAGCPVIVKGHPSHPGTGELVAQALASAVEDAGLPAGVFSFVQCEREQSRVLIEAEPVKAVAFTGSLQGGMALYRIAAERPDPIPVFAEMGSINPFILLPDILKDSAADIAQGFVGSLTLGTGQFCVNPGLVLALEDENLQTFIDAVGTAISDSQPGVMLNQGICEHYQQGVKALAARQDLEPVGQCSQDKPEAGAWAQPCFYKVTAENFLRAPELTEEIFGPVSILVTCRNIEELQTALAAVKGQLTVTVHATESELAANAPLVTQMAEKAGRLVINGYPTGVEVCHAMVHGGPHPASTDARFTSVGSTAIDRFLRPVCYQNCPDTSLPDELKESNPLGIPRFVDGQWA